MSPAATKIIIKPPPITVNHHPKSEVFLCKTRFSCPSFCTLEESATFHRKSAGFIKTIASVSMETRLVNGSDDDRCINPKTSAFEHEALSKWVVAVAFGGFIILRHDDLASWAATGCISNFILSIALKRILKQDRPVSEVSSGPGMPSSHAQTLFFTLVFVIMSVIKSMEMNGVMMIIGILLVALGMENLSQRIGDFNELKRERQRLVELQLLFTSTDHLTGIDREIAERKKEKIRNKDKDN
ncbi:hypothetical protein E3N88_29969 [Mikania micrantha]|uniref:Phosphatidic acid phosphatase type 2/haloperoxidase domain-containing protein n=1 Tax=Mikania micrantha TaxID=192012 RepID=A0A5N6MKY8_9ASTR|nr:hypothetical protein E3N88_29969 [Mikania micrantha]